MTRIVRRIEGDALFLQNPQSGESLEVRETVAGGAGTIAPVGRLTAEMGNDLEDEMTAIALLCDRMIIDMRGVDFIANSVIRKILEVQHMVDARNGAMVIKGVRAPIYGVFEEMGLESVFDIETADTALSEERTSDEM